MAAAAAAAANKVNGMLASTILLKAAATAVAVQDKAVYREQQVLQVTCSVKNSDTGQIQAQQVTT